MDTLVKDFHADGPSKAWLERMAFFVLHSEDLNELGLSWFGQYLETINNVVTKTQELWPPVIVALRFLHEKCPTLKRAVHAISH